MKINRLQVENFRNIRNLCIEPSIGWNFVYGENAQGKSSLLESIYYLAFAKSFKNARDEQLIHFKSSYMKVKGEVLTGKGSFQLEILANNKGKLCKYNESQMERLADYTGHLKIVVFSPDEISVVRGSPSRRRQFIDALFSQLDENYLDAWQKYRHAVDEKNRVLKEFQQHKDHHLVSVYQEEFYSRLIQLYTLRLSYTREFLPLIEKQYLELFGGKEKISSRYQFKALMEDFVPGNVRELGKNHLEKEKEQGVTLWGPHLDDILFYLNRKPVRLYSSQGQLKSLVLAMKMASVFFISQKTGALPVLLIDDFRSEWDNIRMGNFLKALPAEIQVILTTTSLSESLKDKGKVFKMEAGEVLTA